MDENLMHVDIFKESQAQIENESKVVTVKEHKGKMPSADVKPKHVTTGLPPLKAIMPEVSLSDSTTEKQHIPHEKDLSL